MNVIARAFAGLGFLVVVLGAALFVAAGTFAYWQAWVFLAVFVVMVVMITIYLGVHDRALLARRVRAGPVAEATSLQKCIQSMASFVFLGIFVVSGLDWRYEWSQVPAAVVVLGDGLVVLGLGAVFGVFRANPFTSGTIEVAREQKVISTGPYRLVRHPMYAAALVFVLGIPIALGSYWGLLGLPALATVIVWRLLDEEQYLSRNLDGYEAYRARVKYRLVPYLW